MKKTILGLVVVASLVLAGCSSKEGGTASKRRATAGGTRPATTDTVVAGGEDAVAGAGAAAGTGAAAGGRASTRAAGGARSATGGGAAGTRGADTPGGVDFGPPGQGISAGSVKIGVWVLNTDAACNVVGATNTPGNCGNRDHTVEVQALTDWANDTGGVAGRKLEVVIHETLANNSSWTDQAESACERFSADEKVFLAISEPALGRPHFAHCMARRGIPVIDPGPWLWDAKDFEDLSPHLYQPSRPRADRWVKAYIDGLAERGFFRGDVKVGLFRYDSPAHTRATDRVMLPALAAHGVRQVEQAIIRTPASVAALSDMNAELSSHILRFKTAGVNRVVFLAGTGEFHFFYFRQADSQGFKPRYGMSTSDLLTLSSTNAPGGQLEGAIAVGWGPGFDTPAEHDPGPNGASTTCKKLMLDRGVEDPWNGRNVKCDAYFFLRHVLGRAPALNVKGVRAAVDALGQTFEPATTFATSFGPGRYDGSSVWRHMTFRSSCTCFVYEGPNHTF